MTDPFPLPPDTPGLTGATAGAERPVHAGVLAQLRAAWTATQQGQPELLLLEGAAGLGKSHLAAALCREVRREGEGSAGPGPQTVVAPPGSAGGRSLVSALLRGLPALTARRDATFVAAARPHLPEYPWPPLIAVDAGSDPLAVLARGVAEQAQRGQPLLVVVEDLHDQSPQDCRFLDALWARLLLSGRPALLLVTTRPLAEYPEAALAFDALDRTAQLTRGRSCLRQTLDVVSREEVAALVRSHLHTAPPAGLVPWLHDHSGGHPLRTAELLHVLRDRGALVQRPGGPPTSFGRPAQTGVAQTGAAHTASEPWENGGQPEQDSSFWTFTPPPPSTLPTSLTGILLARLRAVQPHAAPWALLTALAVLDAPTSERPLRQVAGLGREVFGAARDWLAHRGLIRVHAGAGASTAAGSLYLPGHPLYGPLLRGELNWNELYALHARAAEAELDPVARAWHARHAGHPQAAALTAEALRVALDRAAHSETVREARALLDELPEPNGASNAAPPPFSRDELRTALVGALHASGQLEEVLAETADEASSLPLPLLAARATTLAERGALQEVVALGLSTLPHPDAGRWPAAHLELEGATWRSLINAGALDEAEARLVAALGETPPYSARWMQLLELQSHLYHRRGDYHLALHLGREAITRGEARRSPDHLWRAHNSVGALAIHMSLWTEAETHLRAAHAIAQAGAMVERLMINEANLAYLHLMRGEYIEAEAGSWTQYRRAEACGNIRVQGLILWNLGICRLWRGDPEEAHRLMRQSWHRWPSVGAANPTDFAEALALAGRLEEARHELAQPDHDYYTEHPNCRARTRLLLGEPHEARREARRIQPHDGAGLRARSALVQAQAALLLNDPAGAATQLTEARHLAHAAEHRSVLGEIELTAAVAALRGPSPDPATARLCWQGGSEALAHTDGQGHVQFVTRLFAAEVAQLQAHHQVGSPDGTAGAGPLGHSPLQARLRVLGNVQIERPAGLRPWRARKVKELLGLLLCAHYAGDGALPLGGDRRQGGLPRERLMLELWPEADPHSADLSFRKTVTRLREALGEAAQLIRTGQGHYLLDRVHSDLDPLLEAMHSGHDADVARLYTAPFLNDLDLAAAVPLRDALHGRWRQALLRLAERDPQDAQTHLQLLLAHDPLDLDATLHLLTTYRLLGQHEAHAALLRRARTLYQTTFGELPQELA